jgi:hypothetical protein
VNFILGLLFVFHQKRNFYVYAKIIIYTAHGLDLDFSVSGISQDNERNNHFKKFNIPPFRV